MTGDGKKPVVIAILVEDCVSGPILKAEHGLAVWIDTGSRSILFDAGQSGLLLANAGELEIGIGAVDVVALSHGHEGHGGAMDSVPRPLFSLRCRGAN